jgi:hypothetical protein
MLGRLSFSPAVVTRCDLAITKAVIEDANVEEVSTRKEEADTFCDPSRPPRSIVDTHGPIPHKLSSIVRKAEQNSACFAPAGD